MTDPTVPAQPTTRDDVSFTPDVMQALVAVVDVCQAVVPGAVGVSVTLLRDKEPYTLVTSTNLAARLDEIQYAEGRGPCLESLSTGRPVDAPDVAADDRWGSYPALAAAAGVGSVYAHPLPTEDLAWGAVNVYGAAPQAFTGEDRERIAVLAHQVAISLTLLLRQGELSERTRQLQQALTSRTVIDVAKGILVADHAISPDAAFELLKVRSQQTNVRLRDVAAELVDSRSSAPGGGGSPAPGGGSAT